MTNPYLAGLELVKQHPGTSGQAALAKCILSLYNPVHAFSMGEILGTLDERYTKAVLDMVNEYARHGETAELRRAGEWAYENFPRLIELSNAMHGARIEVRDGWDRERAREAEEEDRREEEKRRQREAGAKTLYCGYCKCDTKHLPIADEFECQECYERQPA